jgi:hypothetical protein
MCVCTHVCNWRGAGHASLPLYCLGSAIDVVGSGWFGVVVGGWP